MADEAEFNLTFAEIKKLKVAELKARLSKLGLPVSGLKADLVARLASFLESRALEETLTAENEEESEEPKDIISPTRKLPPREARNQVVFLDYDSDDDYESPHEHISRDVSQVVTQMTTNIAKEQDDSAVASEESVIPDTSMVDESTGDIHKDIGQGGQEMRGEEAPVVAKERNLQEGEKLPEEQVEDNETESQESKEVENQPDEPVQAIELETKPEEIDRGPDLPTSSTKETKQEVEPIEQDYVLVSHSDVPEDIGFDTGEANLMDVGEKIEETSIESRPQPVNQSDHSVDAINAEVLSEVIDPFNEKHGDVSTDTQHVPSSATASQEPKEKLSTDEIMETESEQDITHSSIGQEQDVSESPKETPSLEAVPPLVPSYPQAPLHEPAKDQPPAHMQARSPTQPMSQSPDRKSLSPPHFQSPPDPQIPSQPPIASHFQTDLPPPSVPQEHRVVTPEETSTFQESTPPKDHPPTDKLSEPSGEVAFQNDEPQEPDKLPQPQSPRETVPSSNALTEAKMKARSLVEMRERRLKEAGTRDDDSGYDVDHYEPERITTTSRQEKKKKKKKKRKKTRNEEPKAHSETAPDDEGIEVEYVPETLDVRDPVYAQFASIFETFKLSENPEPAKKDDGKDKAEDDTADNAKKDGENDDEMDTDSEEEEEAAKQKKEEQPGDKTEKLSKKKLKLKNRMSVAELKQTVHRPDVVEMHDVTAPDPKLLVYLKACRNTVPVPRHWCFKRKFLQGKRGIIKPPFQLPDFIQKTGIMEMREALQEKEDAKNMKAKMREKIRPKMGKIDIDYQKLHDAFFKWQTKPKMSIHGDLYYEGKEFETKLKEKKPGDLSEDLRTALGMPTGQGSNLVPPPWLIAMQRYGPPPSYPNLKIRGLNAPIPEGASFGYHAGGWGKPPVDEHGRPLYGDVFGVQQSDMNLDDDEQIDSNLWGELESESEESEESEEESEEEAPDQSGLVTPAETGLVTPSGLTSIPAGMETPDMIELRKRKNIEDAMESGAEQPNLYTVLPEKRAGVGGMMMGTSHVYDLATVAPTGTRKTPGGLSEGVEVALDPSELELDPAAMQARYDEQLREQQNTQKEDFSDMVAEHAARQQKKRKKTTDSGKAAKKYKEFKF